MDGHSAMIDGLSPAKSQNEMPTSFIERCMRPFIALLPESWILRCVASRYQVRVLVCLNEKAIGPAVQGGANDGAELRCLAGFCHWRGSPMHLQMVIDDIRREIGDVHGRDGLPNTVDDITGEWNESQ